MRFLEVGVGLLFTFFYWKMGGNIVWKFVKLNGTGGKS